MNAYDPRKLNPSYIIEGKTAPAVWYWRQGRGGKKVGTAMGLYSPHEQRRRGRRVPQKGKWTNKGGGRSGLLNRSITRKKMGREGEKRRSLLNVRITKTKKNQKGGGVTSRIFRGKDIPQKGKKKTGTYEELLSNPTKFSKRPGGGERPEKKVFSMRAGRLGGGG